MSVEYRYEEPPDSAPAQISAWLTALANEGWRVVSHAMRPVSGFGFPREGATFVLRRERETGTQAESELT